jgi:hypothetical protein
MALAYVFFQGKNYANDSSIIGVMAIIPTIVQDFNSPTDFFSGNLAGLVSIWFS